MAGDGIVVMTGGSRPIYAIRPAGGNDLDFDGCIDPWVVFTEAGLLFSAIELGNREDPQRFRLLQVLSADSGQTWPDEPRRLGHSHDHALIAGSSEAAWPLFLVSRRSETAAFRGASACPVRRTIRYAFCTLCTDRNRAAQQSGPQCHRTGCLEREPADLLFRLSAQRRRI